MTRVTIRDVAKAAGVSPATVSRVLNKPDLVESDTRERVMHAMASLNFQPNAIARGLSAQSTDTLGLIVPGITGLFFNELYEGIDRTSQMFGMKVLLFNAEDSRERALDGFSFLGQHRVNGIIFTSKLVSEEFDPIIQRLRIPVVLVLTQSTARTPLASFRVDDMKAVFDSVSYLVSRGHRNIGFIGGRQPDEMTGELRTRGYKMGLQHFGIDYDPRKIEHGGNYRFDDGYHAMQRLLERQGDIQLTAVCTGGDEMALGAMRCLRDNGLSVPDDISIVGYDDLQISRMVIPRLTTVAQPFAEIGAQAVHWLMGALGKLNTPSETGSYFLPHKIVERESVKTLF